MSRVGIFGFLAATTALASHLRVGDPAPNFQLQTPFASQPTFARSNRAIVLEFWATWCVPCVEQIPHFNELALRFRGSPIDFVSVTDEPEQRIRGFLLKHPIEGLVALDENGATILSLGVETLPATILIGPNGRIAAITSPAHLNASVIEGLLAGQTLHLRAPLKSRDRSGTNFTAIVRASEETGDDVILKPGLLEIRGATLRAILMRLARLPEARIIIPENVQRNRYDVLIEIDGASEERLNKITLQTLQSALNVVISREQRRVPVLVLGKTTSTLRRLRPSASAPASSMTGDTLEFTGAPLQALAEALEHELHRNIVDETELPGLFDFTLHWVPGNPETLIDAARTQLGLAIAESTRPMDHVIVTPLRD